MNFAMAFDLTTVLKKVDVPFPVPLHCPHDADSVCDFCPLPNPDVGPSVLVCDVKHTFPFWSMSPQVYAVSVIYCIEHFFL